MEEPAPYTDTTGAAGGGGCRFLESPSQDQRLQAQRLRTPEVRAHVQTPQNRPHGHQSPELPEGYGECPTAGKPKGVWFIQRWRQKFLPVEVFCLLEQEASTCISFCVLEKEISADGSLRLAN